MARRGSNAEMNLDSLLDTLTNVVGVLIMILMLTTLNVRQAVQRILDLDPSQLSISDSEVASAQKQAAAARLQREQLEAKWKQLAPATPPGLAAPAPGESLASLIAKLDALKAQPSVEMSPEAPAQDATKKLEESKRRRDELSQKLVSVEEELARLKSQLDMTQVVAAPPAKIVSLPNPREAPAEATEFRVIIRGSRIAPFAPAAVRDRAKKQVETLLRSPQLKSGASEIDCQKLVEQFNKQARVIDPNFQVQLAVQQFDLKLVFALKPAGGETAREVVAPASELRKGLRQLKSRYGEKFYIRFLVWNDSFDAYVAARSVCDEMGVLAGWEPYTTDYTWTESLGLQAPCAGRPPPPPPPKPNPNPPAPAPAAPPKPVPNDVVD
ncbi:MAG: hypothetical protein U0939_18965 [Pirellulales bacterium]